MQITILTPCTAMVTKSENVPFGRLGRRGGTMCRLASYCPTMAEIQFIAYTM